MGDRPLAELEGPFGESPRDRLLRESFLLGFIILLSLVLGLGVLSWFRVASIEQDITQRSQVNQGLLRTVMELKTRTGRLSVETKLLQVTRALGGVTAPAARRVRTLEKDIEETLEQGRRGALVSLPEWTQVEESYTRYREALERIGQSEVVEPLPSDVTKEFDAAVEGLLNRIQAEVRSDETTAAVQRKEAQRDIFLFTGACLAVGLVVSILSFLETRRRIVLLGRAYTSIAGNKELIESTLEGMDSAVLTTGLDGRVTRINGTAVRVFGLDSAESAVGRPVAEVLAAEPRLVGLIEPLVESESPGRRYLGRIELGAEGSLFDVAASPLVVGGTVRGFIVVLTDVTEAERASEELRRNRALMAIGQMTAQVAHEIKNPLGGVRLSAQVLAKMHADDEESLAVIRRIESSVDHLARTVAELNQFARPRDLTLERMRLDALLDDLVEMVRDRVEAKRIRVVRHYDPAVPDAWFDEGELRKALINFLINALEASPEGASLELSLAPIGDPPAEARIAIRDEGHGMNEETRRRLFEPFFTTKASGTGLGMAIARKIVEQHKGRLEVRSSVGRGTSVTVTLPLTLVPAREAAVQEQS